MTHVHHPSARQRRRPARHLAPRPSRRLPDLYALGRVTRVALDALRAMEAAGRYLDGDQTACGDFVDALAAGVRVLTEQGE